MSNRLDLFQPEQTDLAIAAASAVVFLDGVFCPGLEVIEIIRSGWPDFSTARLTYNPAALSSSQTESVEQIEAQLCPGAQICISQHYNSSPPLVVVGTLPVFVGQIETVERNLSDKGENIQVVAADFNADLKRTIIYGRYVSDVDGSAKFLMGSDPIFNEDTAPNASESNVNFNGENCRVFAAELSSAAYWTYAEIIDYLLCVYIQRRKLTKPPLKLLQALTDRQQAAELDLTGLNVLQALHLCCERVGLNFRFLPVSSPDSSLTYRGPT
jgi:hypothetical protein